MKTILVSLILLLGLGASCQSTTDDLEPCLLPCDDDDEETGEDEMSEDPVCGDGVVQGEEECDDGNQIVDDECTNFCTLPTCGDGIIQPETEECDPGVPNDGDLVCTDDCELVTA